MQNQMNCIYVESRGGQWQYKQMPIPVLNSGQVLIKVEGAAINRCDLNFIRGIYPSKKTFPCVPGFEGSGTILLTGGGMSCWGMSGKRVAFYTESQYGSFADYSVAEAINCVELDQDQSFEEGSCALINPISVIGMLDICKSAKVPSVINNAATSSLSKLVVQLGLMMNRLFKDNGINVINIVRRSEAIQELQAKGCQYVLDSNDENFIDELEELARQLDARIFFDALSGELSSTILHAMPKHSTVYVYGRMAKSKLTNISAFDLISQAQCVKGFWFDRYLKSNNVVSLQLLLRKAKNQLKTTFASSVSEHFMLSQFQDAIDLHDSDDRKGKIILLPNRNILKSKKQLLKEQLQQLALQAQQMLDLKNQQQQNIQQVYQQQPQVEQKQDDIQQEKQNNEESEKTEVVNQVEEAPIQDKLEQIQENNEQSEVFEDQQPEPPLQDNDLEQHDEPQ